MKDICIPVPRFDEHQIAEVTVTVNGKKEHFNFRVESFSWDVGEEVESSDITEKILNLRNQIEGYDKDWELVQIYTPKTEAHYIQVLFRQKAGVLV